MELRACPRCGSRNMDAGTMGAGVTFGVTSWKSMCKDCGYQGEPLLFDSEKSYKKFLIALHDEDKEQDIANEDTAPSFDKAEYDEIKTIVGDLSAESPDGEEKTPKKKGWFFEILLAICIAAISVGFVTISSIDIFGLNVAILYGVLLFVVATVIILFIIVIIEYFLIKMKKTIIR